MSETFDVREVRHRLKQLADDGETRLFENGGDLECPACEARFERLFVTRRTATSFPENDGSRFCLMDDPTRIFAFRH